MIDTSVIDATVAELLAAATDVSAHSRASYERRWRQWKAFADFHDLPPLPVEAEVLEAFVVARHSAGVSASGIAANLSAIVWFHSRAGGDPTIGASARRVLRALERSQPSSPVRPAPVLSVGALLAMAAAPPRLGIGYAVRVIRAALPDVRRGQLRNVSKSDLCFADDGLSVTMALPFTAAGGTHRDRPARSVRLVADPGWLNCPVRALVQLQAAGEPLFSDKALAEAATRRFDPVTAPDGIPARVQIRDSALICVGYAGALRNEDLVRARVEHLSLIGDRFILRIPRAKSSTADQAVVLAPRDDALDPVAAINRWLAIRGDHDGPLFTQVHHQVAGSNRPNGELPSGSISEVVSDLARWIGLPPTVSGYSLRRSWATHRYLESPDSVAEISMQLRHARIDMTVRYIEDLRLGLIDAAELLSTTAIVATDDGQPSARKNLGFSRAPLGRLQRQARNISAPATDAAAATLRTSAGHRNSWTKFCATNDLPALPSTPEAVGFFVASCADRGLAPSYIRALLATIRRDHDATGAEVPGLTELAGEVLDAYSRSGGDFRVRKAPILTIRELEAMAQRTIDGPVGRRFQGDREQGAARDRLIVTLGYAGAMRADDLRRSHLDDIERTPWGAVLRLRSSKDNQSGARAESVLVLRREGPLDPIAALDSFHACTGLSSGPLLPSRFGIDPAQPVGRNHVRDRIAAIAAAAGVTKSPTAHSLRRSWATHAYEAGIDLVTIQRHLRHANVTDTKGYVDSLSVWIDNPAADLTTSLIAPSERISTDRGADR